MLEKWYFTSDLTYQIAGAGDFGNRPQLENNSDEGLARFIQLWRRSLLAVTSPWAVSVRGAEGEPVDA